MVGLPFSRAGMVWRALSFLVVVVEAKGFVLRRNWLPVIACAVSFVGGVLTIMTTKGGVSLAPVFGLLAAWFGGILGPIMFARRSFPRAVPTSFRATETGLTLMGSEEVPSEDILEAKLVPRRSRDATVELSLRGPGPKVLSLRTGFAEARALLELFGTRRTRFRLILPYGKRFLAAFALFALPLVVFALADGEGAQALFMLPGCMFYAALVAWPLGMMRGRLVVGADGFTTKWVFYERFTAFRDVASVTRKVRFGSDGVEDTLVELRNGRRVRLRTVEAPNTDEERGNESRAMLTHMEEAFTRSQRLMDGSVDVPALVRRGARSAGEWLSGLDALVRGGGSRYRVAAVSAEMLADIATDPSAEVESRVGAAAALIRMGDDERLRTRVRVAAEACADSELRETLLALSEARDDDGAERALGLLRRTAG